MAVITLDVEKNTVTVLVEKNDLVHYVEDNIITVASGSKYTIGKTFVNGEINLCMIRGER